MNTAFNDQLPPWLNEDKSTGTISFNDVRQACFSDLPPSQQDHWVSQFVACPTRVTFDAISYVPYGKIPATYVIFKDDVELKAEVQEHMAKAAFGDDVRVEYVEGGHCAFIKRPQEVAEAIVRACERHRGG